jgi:hypothetical protein
MEDLQETLRPLHETLLDRGQALSFLARCLGVLHYFVEDRLVGLDSFIAKVGILSLMSKDVLNTFPLKGVLLLALGLAVP